MNPQHNPQRMKTMIRLVAFILGCVAGYTLNENLDRLTGKDDPTMRRVESVEDVKAEGK